MKRLFVLLMALAVLGVQAFAAPAELSRKVARGAKESRNAVETKKTEVLSLLKGFRQVTEVRTEFNGSYTMQDMLGLMDSYLELADMNETAALSLNDEINRPIEAGWGGTISIAQFVRDNSHHVMAGTSTANDFDRFEELLGRQTPFASYADKTVAAAPRYLDDAAKPGLKQEAEKTFRVYFEKNPNGKVTEKVYKPLAALLTDAIGLNQMIARTHNVDDKENYAGQWFFSNDIPGKYAALKAVNPELAAATNELMKSFMHTVTNGMPGYMPEQDRNAYRKFTQDIGFRY